MKKLRITIGNKSYDVTVEDLTEPDTYHTMPGSASLPASAPAQAQSPPAMASPALASAAPTGKAPAKQQLPMDVGSITSPMAGAIKSVLVKPNDQVKERQPLVILEAMKMENQITAPTAGTVTTIAVKEGDSVHEGQLLVVLK